MPIPQGKVVGGSTKLNRMVFDRGSKSDYNAWETFGNPGWNFEGILPYIKKVCASTLQTYVPKIMKKTRTSSTDNSTERKVHAANEGDPG